MRKAIYSSKTATIAIDAKSNPFVWIFKIGVFGTKNLWHFGRIPAPNAILRNRRRRRARVGLAASPSKAPGIVALATRWQTLQAFPFESDLTGNHILGRSAL